MEYVKVESSQIESVGFGDGVYGPETLGVIFLPNKKQQAEELPGSTYHYGNVTPRMHLTMMGAEHVYGWFAKNVKAFPDQFPYTKVESDPTLSDSEAQAKTNIISGPEDTPSTGTALALIDTMADDLLFTPGAVTDEQLEAGRQWYLTEAKKYNITTEKSRKELKRFARSLQKLRTGIEARAKEITGATKRKIATIDAEKRRLVGKVAGIEDEVLSDLTAWEQEKEATTIRLSNQVKAIEAKADLYSYTDIPSIESAIAELEVYDVSDMQEFKVSAESAVTAVLKVLKPELERRKVAEKEKEELERLRKESADRAEADRIEAAAKKLADEKIQAAVEAARVETRQEVIAELNSESGEPEDGDNETSIPPTWKLDMIAPQPAPDYLDCTSPKFEAYIANDQKADDPLERILRFNEEAVLALRNYKDYDDMIEAIAKGMIPHVTINYEA